MQTDTSALMGVDSDHPYLPVWLYSMPCFSPFRKEFPWR